MPIDPAIRAKADEIVKKKRGERNGFTLKSTRGTDAGGTVWHYEKYSEKIAVKFDNGKWYYSKNGGRTFTEVN